MSSRIVARPKTTRPCQICNEETSHLTGMPFRAIASPCGHVCCYECGLRRLYCDERQECAVCTRKLEKLVIVEGQPDQELFPSNDSTLEMLAQWPKKLSHFSPMVAFEVDNPEVYSSIKQLLYWQCSGCMIDISLHCGTLRYTSDHFDYCQKHLVKKHEMYMCDVCFYKKRRFSMEETQYGSEDELMDHKRADHVKCNLCQAKDPVYYFDCDELEEHQRKVHSSSCKLCPTAGPSNYFRDVQLGQHLEKIHFYDVEHSSVISPCSSMQTEVQTLQDSGIDTWLQPMEQKEACSFRDLQFYGQARPRCFTKKIPNQMLLLL